VAKNEARAVARSDTGDATEQRTGPKTYAEL